MAAGASSAARLDAFPELRGGAAEGALSSALGGARPCGPPLPPVPAPPAAARRPRARGAHAAERAIMPCFATAPPTRARARAGRHGAGRTRASRTCATRCSSQSRASEVRFLASMTHELRTPLRRSSATWRSSRGDGGPPSRRCRSAHLGRVKPRRGTSSRSSEILTFSRIEAGKRRSRPARGRGRARARCRRAVRVAGAAEGRRAEIETGAGRVAIDPIRRSCGRSSSTWSATRSSSPDGREVSAAARRRRRRRDDRRRDTAARDHRRRPHAIFDPFTRSDQSCGARRAAPGSAPGGRRLAPCFGGELVDERGGRGATFPLRLPCMPPLLRRARRPPPSALPQE